MEIIPVAHHVKYNNLLEKHIIQFSEAWKQLADCDNQTLEKRNLTNYIWKKRKKHPYDHLWKEEDLKKDIKHASNIRSLCGSYSYIEFLVDDEEDPMSCKKCQVMFDSMKEVQILNEEKYKKKESK